MRKVRARLTSERSIRRVMRCPVAAPGAVASWYRPGVYVLFADGSEGTIVEVGNDTCTVEMPDSKVLTSLWLATG